MAIHRPVARSCVTTPFDHYIVTLASFIKVVVIQHHDQSFTKLDTLPIEILARATVSSQTRRGELKRSLKSAKTLGDSVMAGSDSGWWE